MDFHGIYALLSTTGKINFEKCSFFDEEVLDDGLFAGYKNVQYSDKEKHIIKLKNDCYLIYDQFSFSDSTSFLNELRQLESKSITLNEIIKKKSSDWGDLCIIYIDIRNKIVLLAPDLRNHFPIFYRIEKEFIAFSTIQSFLLKLADCNIDENSVYERICLGHSLWDKTLFKEIKQIPACCLTVVEKGICKTIRYFPEEIDKIEFPGLEIFKDTLETTIKPVAGIEGSRLALSGGLDSRLILGSMLNLGIKPSIFLFGETKSPDCIISKKISDKYSLDLLHIIPDTKFLETLPQIIMEHISEGEGICDLDSLHSHLVYKLIKDKIPVLIEGNYMGNPRGILNDFCNGALSNPRIFMSNQLLTNYYPFFNEDPQKINDSLLENLSDIPEWAENLPDYYYYEFNRRGKRVSKETVIQRNYLSAFNPLETQAFAKQVFMIPQSMSRNSRFFWDLLTSLKSDLSMIPLESHGFYMHNGNSRLENLLIKGYDRLRIQLGLNSARYHSFSSSKNFDTIRPSLEILLDEIKTTLPSPLKFSNYVLEDDDYIVPLLRFASISLWLVKYKEFSSEKFSSLENSLISRIK
ncbi:MAG: hypothetical protein JXA60_12415 [Candidatus Coatesbacteria bacterium]|nr:hypothetical protein [Candidatus Coatesbacteria bacterium]